MCSPFDDVEEKTPHLTHETYTRKANTSCNIQLKLEQYQVAKTLIYRDSYVTRVLSYERFQSFFPVSALHFCFFNYTLGNRDFQKMLLDWSTFASVKSRLLSKNRKKSDRGGAEERKPVSKETASRVRLNFRSTSEPFQLEIKLNLCKQQ